MVTIAGSCNKKMEMPNAMKPVTNLDDLRAIASDLAQRNVTLPQDTFILIALPPKAYASIAMEVKSQFTVNMDPKLDEFTIYFKEINFIIRRNQA